MKRHNTIIILLLSTLSLVAQQYHFTATINLPAEQTLPDGINNLLVVNNIATQPIDFGHQLTIQTSSYNDSIDLSSAPLQMLFSATEALEQSELFDQVALLEISQNNKSFFSTSNLLSNTQVGLLCRDYQSDAVLSCNRLVIINSTKLSELNSGEYLATLDAYLTSSWTLYFLDNRQSINYTYNDTLSWTATAVTPQQAYKSLPDIQTALLDMAHDGGLLFAAKFQPLTIEADRYLYNDSKTDIFAKGFASFANRQWSAAAEQWKEEYTKIDMLRRPKKADKLHRAYAAANIAVAYEMQADYNSAIQWAYKAQADFSKLSGAKNVQHRTNLIAYWQELRNIQYMLGERTP